MRRVAAFIAAVAVAAGPALAAAVGATGVDAQGAGVIAPARVAPMAPEVLRANFEQERHVPGFARPLRSTGEVVMIRGEGLRWETRAPFPSVMIVRGDTMRVRDAQGREQRVGEGAGAAVPRLVQALLGALLAQDREALAMHFDVVGAPIADGGAWRMVLTPRAAPLSGLYERIEVEGTLHVERIALHGRDGGRTLLRFTGTRVSARASDAERRALD